MVATSVRQHRLTSMLWRPQNLSEAWSLLQQFRKAALAFAGGTAIQLDWEAGIPLPDHLIDLSVSGAWLE